MLPGLRIKENKEVYEGEVIELSPEETENQMGGYGKVISHVIIGLKSVKGTKQLKLDPTIFDSLQKEKVQVSHCRVQSSAESTFTSRQSSYEFALQCIYKFFQQITR